MGVTAVPAALFEQKRPLLRKDTAWRPKKIRKGHS